MKRIYVLIIVSLILALPTLACSSTTPEASPTPSESAIPAATPMLSASDYVTQGAANYDVGEFDAAMSEFQNALDLEPENVEAHINIGKIYLDQEQYADAVDHYELALESDPGNAEATIGLCVSIAFTQPEKAETYCQAAEMLEPQNADVQNGMGIALALQNKTDEAIDAFKEAIRIDPEHEWAHNNLGFVYLNIGLLDEAIAELNLALEITPENAKVYNNLGISYARQGDYEQAIPAYEAALRLNPENASANYDFGLIYSDLGEAEEAIAYFEKFLELNPDSLERSKVESMIADLQDSLALTPGTYLAFDETIEADDEDGADVFSFFVSSADLFSSGDPTLDVTIMPDSSLDISITVLDTSTGDNEIVAAVNDAGLGSEEHLEVTLPDQTSAMGVYAIRITAEEGTGTYHATFGGSPAIGFSASNGWEITGVFAEMKAVFFVVSTFGKAGEPISIKAIPRQEDHLDLFITAVDTSGNVNLGTLNEGGTDEPEGDTFSPDNSIYLFIVGDQEGLPGQVVMKFTR